MTVFEGFYQLGFVARDLELATAALGQRYGVKRFRTRRLNETMRSAHAYAGPVMIEVIEVEEQGPPLYREHLPARADAARLHHHGFRSPEEAPWPDLIAALEARGLATPLRGDAMEAHLRYLYADTRVELRIYSEFVCLTWPALEIYDDVPQN